MTGVLDNDLSLSVADAGALDRLVADGLPASLTALPTTRRSLRETYFDTPDGELRRRGARCVLRLEDGAEPVVALVIGEPAEGGISTRRHLETPALGTGVFETLTGTGELANEVRRLIRPTALRPRVAIDIERQVRRARRGRLRRPELEFHYDSITVQIAGIAQRFFQVHVLRLRRGPTSLQRVSEALRANPAVVIDGRDTLDRALEVLEIVRTRVATANIRDTHPIAVLALHGARLALLPSPTGFTLPTVRAGDSETVQRLLVELCGAPAREVVALGTSTFRTTDATLSIWVADGVEPRADGDARTAWLPCAEVIDRLGTPAFRDLTLVTALRRLARRRDRFHEVVSRPSTGTPGWGGPGVPDAPVEHPTLYLDPEISHLAFSARLLELASDARIPLMERVGFLATSAANTDEFYSIHVARLKRRAASGSGWWTEGGLAAGDLLDVVRLRAAGLRVRRRQVLGSELLPALASHGLRLRRWAELDEPQRASLTRRFALEIQPLVTPRALRRAPGHPFPTLDTLCASLAVALEDEGAALELGLLPIPTSVPGFLPVPGTTDVLPVEDLIGAHAQGFFPGRTVTGVHAFRVTRSGALDLDEDEVEDFVEAVAAEVERRASGPIVRLEVQEGTPPRTRDLLLRELRESGEGAELDAADVVELPVPLDVRLLTELRPEAPAAGTLRFDPLPASASARPGSFLDHLSSSDALVHHPYDSFDDTVLRFFRDAATDPDVVSIKTTLYRTGPAVIETLVGARVEGKEVAVFVELKARENEAQNLASVRALTEAGVTLVYGFVGVETHAKLALVTRREPSGIRRYAHVASGNYNEVTARRVVDFGLFTTDSEITADVGDLFNELIGSTTPPVRRYRRLLVAPATLLAGTLAMIEREVGHALAGRRSGIRAKLNELTDPDVVRALCRASRAGVDIDLLVRGRCSLRPGVAGHSSRIRVRSTLGRFLEHGRMVRFENGGAPDIHVGSADWRPRSLRGRVDVMTPVPSPEHRARLERIFEVEWSSSGIWVLGSDGHYTRTPAGATGLSSAQERFLLEAGAAGVPDVLLGT